MSLWLSHHAGNSFDCRTRFLDRITRAWLLERLAGGEEDGLEQILQNEK